MGEYIKYVGQERKIGTCEDLYYVRYNDFKNHVNAFQKTDGGLEPSEYLNPQHGFRFRFPFPDEDQLFRSDIIQDGISKFDRGLLLELSIQDYQLPEHDGRLTFGVSPGENSWNNTNIFIACPYSGNFRQETSRDPIFQRKTLVEIVSQKVTDEGLWAVIRCPYCRHMWRVDLEDAERLTNAIENAYNAEFAKPLVDRILEGYQVLAS